MQWLRASGGPLGEVELLRRVRHQQVDDGVPVPDAVGEPVPCWPWRSGRLPGRWSRSSGFDRLTSQNSKTAAMLGNTPLGGLAQVVPQAPSVRDLHSLGRPDGRSFREERSAVAADNLNARAFGQPGSPAARLDASGRASTSRSTVLRLTATPKTPAMRAPARPASARPTVASVDRRRSVHRPYRRVSPATCSTNVRRSHNAFPHMNRRTRRHSRTRFPARLSPPQGPAWSHQVTGQTHVQQPPGARSGLHSRLEQR